MDPNVALTEIRKLIEQYDDIDVWDVHDVTDAINLLIDLVDHVAGLDQWMSQGCYLPKAWERKRTAVTS